MDPHIIAARAYEPFIDLLRTNMQNCGAAHRSRDVCTASVRADPVW